MKRNVSIEIARRFYREVKVLAASQSTYSQFRRYLSPKFTRHSIAWHAWRQFMEQDEKVDAVQEKLAVG